MPTTNASSRRALTVALVAVLLTLGIAGSANAESEPENPDVGGGALQREGLVIDGQAAPLPAGDVKSFVVADLTTGDILAAQNAHEPLPPASTLKMLTALTVLPRIDLDAVYTAVDDDITVEGSKVGVVPGSTYTGRQLAEGLFLISGNDAAHALGNLNGGIAATVEQMQAEAWRVQAYDTVVRNTSGLDAPQQVSSAYDLALIARAGMQRKDFAGFASLEHSTFPQSGTGDPKQRPTFEIWTQNDLLSGDYQGVIGVKSGFTTQAGRTFAVAARRGDEAYLVTLMGIGGNTYRTGAAYLDWAFENAESLDPVGELAEPKYKVAQSDGAVIVAGTALAAANRPGVARTEQSPGSHVGPLIPLAMIVGSALTIWFNLRLTRRNAWRRCNDARSQRTTQVRVPQDVSA